MLRCSMLMLRQNFSQLFMFTNVHIAHSASASVGVRGVRLTTRH
jgi:hypothetical protein